MLGSRRGLLWASPIPLCGPDRCAPAAATLGSRPSCSFVAAHQLEPAYSDPLPRRLSSADALPAARRVGASEHSCRTRRILKIWHGPARDNHLSRGSVAAP